MPIQSLILFLSLILCAYAGSTNSNNVVYPVFGAGKKTCVTALVGNAQMIRPDSGYGQKLYASILKTIEEQDPSLVHMHLDFTSKIWEWEPTDVKNSMRIRFARDEQGRAVRVFVVRTNFLQDLIVEDLGRVQEIDDELRRRMPAALITIEDNLEALRQRPWPTAGLLL